MPIEGVGRKIIAKAAEVVRALKGVVAVWRGYSVTSADPGTWRNVSRVNWDKALHSREKPADGQYVAFPSTDEFWLNYESDNGEFKRPIEDLSGKSYQLETNYDLIPSALRKAAPLDRRIVCMDYAIADIALRLQDREGSHAVHRAKAFTNSGEFRKLSGSYADCSNFDFILKYTQMPTFVANPLGKTDIIANVFKGMNGPPPGEKARKVFYVASSNHAMTLTFTINNKSGTPQYSVTAYDPNTTYNHVKTVHASPDDFKNLSIQQLFQLKMWEVLAYTHLTWKEQDKLDDGEVSGEELINAGRLWKFYEATPALFGNFDKRAQEWNARDRWERYHFFRNKLMVTKSSSDAL